MGIGNRGKIGLGIGAVLVIAAVGWFGSRPGDADAQSRCRQHVPAIGTPISNPGHPIPRNFDPCTNRVTMTDDARKPSGAARITRDQAERVGIGAAVAHKVRAYLTTYADALRAVGEQGEDVDVYSDREVWLVVAKTEPGQGPRPSLPPYAPTPDPASRKWHYVIVDATIGDSLMLGARSGPNAPDWPIGVPPDTPEDLARDVARAEARLRGRP